MATTRGTGVKPRRCVVFAGGRCIARGEVARVEARVRALLALGDKGTVLAFDALTSEPVELDLREGAARSRVPRVEARGIETEEVRGPGRPRLGVVAREVTLLPRHWAWLFEQTGGASVVLRRLVEAAMKRPDPEARLRRIQESAYRFMSALAGNERGFEEATRALFAGRRDRFEQETRSWPEDVRAHARRLARGAFVRELRATGGSVGRFPRTVARPGRRVR